MGRFLKHVLANYIHSDARIRQVVSQLIYQISRLLSPDTFLKVMIAMSTDPFPPIRSTIEPLLKEMNLKHNGQLASCAMDGIHWTFDLHNLINKKCHVLRGFQARKQCKANGKWSFFCPK